MEIRGGMQCEPRLTNQADLIGRTETGRADGGVSIFPIRAMILRQNMGFLSFAYFHDAKVTSANRHRPLSDTGTVPTNEKLLIVDMCDSNEVHMRVIRPLPSLILRMKNRSTAPART
jgi:hypothetical protein